MAIKTLNSFATELVTELGYSLSNSPFITQTERYFNDACKHLLNYHDWIWRETTDATISTAANTATYPLSTNACILREVRIGGSYDKSLIKTTIEWLSQNDLDLEITGEPVYWYHYGYSTTTQKQTIGLYPIPDATYSIIPYITIIPTDLTSDSTVPIPESFYACLRDGARYYLEMDQGRQPQAAQWLKMFDASLKFLKQRDSVQATPDEPIIYTDVKGNRGGQRFFTGRYPYWGG